jgi:hypothetical protein
MTLFQQLSNRQQMTKAWANGAYTNFPDLLDWKRPLKETLLPDGWTKRTFTCECGEEIIKAMVGINDFRPRTCWECKRLQQEKANVKAWIN